MFSTVSLKATELSAFSCERFYSHPGVELKWHLNEVGILCREYVTSTGINDSKLIKAAEIIGKCHDLAKYTHFFQRRLLGEKVQGSLSTHSKLSAIFASWVINKRLGDPFLAAVGFLCVNSHHGNLKGFESLDDLSSQADWLGGPLIMEQLESIRRRMDLISRELDEIGLHEIPDFICGFRDLLPEIIKTLRSAAFSRLNFSEHEAWHKYYSTLLLFSALVDADKKEAGEVEVKLSGGFLPSDLALKYIGKRFGSGGSEIDVIRGSVFSESDRRLKEVLEGGDVPSIITVTAPTGTGKTLLGLHSALKLCGNLGYKRVIYCLPYINIIEQTHSVFEDVISTYYGKKPDVFTLLKHHHLFSPSRESVSEDLPLDKLLLLTDSWDSKLVITTFEQLMRSMIGCKNSLLKKFHNIAGSVIVLDEVQAIPLEFWRLVRDALLHLAENFNVRIILMTATMPVIFKEKGFELVPEPRKYFKRLERTVLIPQLETAVRAEEFADFALSKWSRGSSALLVLNTVRASKMVYKRVAERLGDEVLRVGCAIEGEIANSSKAVLTYLSTSVIPKERKRRVELVRKLLKERRSVILVSTQVVEAGVDLDFSLVFRDLGPLDSIIQAAGRCNRNWKLPRGQVYVLKVIDENGREDSKKIYGEILPEITSRLFNGKKSVREGELMELVEPYYRDVLDRMNVESDPECKKVLNRIKMLNFEGLANFSLIEEEPKVPVYIEYDEEARHLLKKFKAAVEALGKQTNLDEVFNIKAELRKLRNEMENYVVEVYESEACLRSLKPIIDHANLLYVPYEEVPAYYDPETGFKTTEVGEAKFVIF